MWTQVCLISKALLLPLNYATIQGPLGGKKSEEEERQGAQDKSIPLRMRIWYKEQVWDKITPGLQNWKESQRYIPVAPNAYS